MKKISSLAVRYAIIVKTYRGHFGLGTFWSGDILVWGTFWFGDISVWGTFWPGDILVWGTFWSGTFRSETFWGGAFWRGHYWGDIMSGHHVLVLSWGARFWCNKITYSLVTYYCYGKESQYYTLQIFHLTTIRLSFGITTTMQLLASLLVKLTKPFLFFQILNLKDENKPLKCERGAAESTSDYVVVAKS